LQGGGEAFHGQLLYHDRVESDPIRVSRLPVGAPHLCRCVRRAFADALGALLPCAPVRSIMNTAQNRRRRKAALSSAAQTNRR